LTLYDLTAKFTDEKEMTQNQEVLDTYSALLSACDDRLQPLRWVIENIPSLADHATDELMREADCKCDDLILICNKVPVHAERAFFALQDHRLLDVDHLVRLSYSSNSVIALRAWECMKSHSVATPALMRGFVRRNPRFREAAFEHLRMMPKCVADDVVHVLLNNDSLSESAWDELLSRDDLGVANLISVICNSVRFADRAWNELIARFEPTTDELHHIVRWSSSSVRVGASRVLLSRRDSTPDNWLCIAQFCSWNRSAACNKLLRSSRTTMEHFRRMMRLLPDMLQSVAYEALERNGVTPIVCTTIIELVPELRNRAWACLVVHTDMSANDLTTTFYYAENYRRWILDLLQLRTDCTIEMWRSLIIHGSPFNDQIAEEIRRRTRTEYEALQDRLLAIA
jgi:hypothetical protein